MSPIIVAVLESVVPLFVGQAEKLFPKPSVGAEKHAWVQGMINDLFNAVSVRFNLPSWATPIAGEGEIILKEIIEKALEKIDP